MAAEISDSQEVAALRGLIDDYIQKRLTPKLDAIKQDDKDAQQKRDQLEKKFDRNNWLKDAAHKSAYLLQATHPEKGNHSSIKDSLSINMEEAICNEPWLVGTHLLLPSITKDVAVKNAATLYVWDFLQQEYAGRTLFQRMIDRDGAVLAALSDDQDLALELAKQFASIYERKREIASHVLAKQLYFPLVEEGYHLLAPLFPTAQAHGIYLRLQEDRFSEPSQAARTAKRNQQAYPHGYCDYPNLTVQYLGGNQPQNVSALNAKRRVDQRGGANYLLSSVPPVWKDQGLQAPLGVGSVFDKRGVIGRDRSVYFIAKSLRPFLKSVVDADNNMHIREKRAELVQAIIDRVLDIATALQCLPAGWSAQPACKLSWAQKQWLDMDALPAAQETHKRAQDAALPPPEATEWRERVAEDFARWLNATISTPKTPMGDVEFVEWKHTFLEVL